MKQHYWKGILSLFLLITLSTNAYTQIASLTQGKELVLPRKYKKQFDYTPNPWSFFELNQFTFQVLDEDDKGGYYVLENHFGHEFVFYHYDKDLKRAKSGKIIFTEGTFIHSSKNDKGELVIFYTIKKSEESTEFYSAVFDPEKLTMTNDKKLLEDEQLKNCQVFFSSDHSKFVVTTTNDEMFKNSKHQPKAFSLRNSKTYKHTFWGFDSNNQHLWKHEQVLPGQYKKEKGMWAFREQRPGFIPGFGLFDKSTQKKSTQLEVNNNGEAYFLYPLTAFNRTNKKLTKIKEGNEYKLYRFSQTIDSTFIDEERIHLHNIRISLLKNGNILCIGALSNNPPLSKYNKMKWEGIYIKELDSKTLSSIKMVEIPLDLKSKKQFFPKNKKLKKGKNINILSPQLIKIEPRTDGSLRLIGRSSYYNTNIFVLDVSADYQFKAYKKIDIRSALYRQYAPGYGFYILEKNNKIGVLSLTSTSQVISSIGSNGSSQTKRVNKLPFLYVSATNLADDSELDSYTIRGSDEKKFFPCITGNGYINSKGELVSIATTTKLRKRYGVSLYKVSFN